MSHYIPPLGTTFDARLDSWVVIVIGTGKRIFPEFHGAGWTHRQALLALYREQGRS